MSDNQAGRPMTYDELRDKVIEQAKWIADLQSNMYINCVYCGWRAGEQGQVAADDLKAHVAVCPHHPLYAVKKRASAGAEILRLLVTLKNVKDSAGKTTQYMQMQPKAWALAREYLDRVDMEDGVPSHQTVLDGNMPHLSDIHFYF
jgi:hypothetical protein